MQRRTGAAVGLRQRRQSHLRGSREVGAGEKKWEPPISRRRVELGAGEQRWEQLWSNLGGQSLRQEEVSAWRIWGEWLWALGRKNRTCLLGSPAEWGKGVTGVKHESKAVEKVRERDCVEDIGDQPQVKLLCCDTSSLTIERDWAQKKLLKCHTQQKLMNTKLGSGEKELIIEQNEMTRHRCCFQCFVFLSSSVSNWMSMGITKCQYEFESQSVCVWILASMSIRMSIWVLVFLNWCLKGENPEGGQLKSKTTSFHWCQSLGW